MRHELSHAAIKSVYFVCWLIRGVMPLYSDELHLRYSSAGYCLVALGKAGEARAFQPVSLQLRHMLVSDVQSVQCQTDKDGRLFLGELTLIDSVTAKLGSSSQSVTRTFKISPLLEGSYPDRIHIKKGSNTRIPYLV